MFSSSLIKAITDAANAAGIAPSRLLALVETECGPAGKAFEQDGRTPALLYERHVAYREAKARSARLLYRRAARLETFRRVARLES
ncbi:N-acetylmuramidase domain-containing protein [Rhodopseudomonas sp. BR0G17]|uniref:N-acetylmuramidase domain-containing protein n=1 Tax=Rhodopseudomonas sp. BR0G17 TaxID=2269368 RepID=UPI0013E0506C|nr:N-acetylmuramidase domain-containing protein [Rhodopseudomonas sp. BR0G17]NEW96656.1 DUF3380 domain-containing protein [Rhodopseudomonas sp. BR0G17]